MVSNGMTTLDPKLKETYERIMGTAVPSGSTPPSPAAPVSPPPRLEPTPAPVKPSPPAIPSTSAPQEHRSNTHSNLFLMLFGIGILAIYTLFWMILFRIPLPGIS